MSRVVIVGAGPAGLSAAHRILSESDLHEVIILEETGCIGGISRTVGHRGNRMDIGGHRFFSKSERVMNWWAQRLPLQGKPSYDEIRLGRSSVIAEGGPDPEEADLVMLVRQRISRIFHRSHFYDYPISLKWQTIRNLGFIKTFQAGMSYLVSCVHKLEESNLENFYINRFGRVLYQLFFEGYTEKLWGRHPQQISADWGAQRVKGLSIRALLANIIRKLLPWSAKKAANVETSLIESFQYPKHGLGQLWEAVADEVTNMGGRLNLHCRVTGFDTGPDGCLCNVSYEEHGQESSLEADHFISTMPVKDLVAGLKNVPDSVGNIAKGLPYRDFVTVGILVNRLKLRNQTNIKTLGDIVPDCWIYVQDETVKLGRIQIFNNWSPYMVEDPLNTVWMGLEYFCDEGDAFWTLSDEECTKLAIQELVRIRVLDIDETVLDSHCERVKKAYPAYFDTYDRMDQVVEYLNGYPNLYCVGRNGQHRYNNMDHSVLTAFEAADNILQNRRTKDNIWNVNTEKEYHESASK